MDFNLCSLARPDIKFRRDDEPLHEVQQGRGEGDWVARLENIVKIWRKQWTSCCRRARRVL